MRLSDIIEKTVSSGMAKYKATEGKGGNDPVQIMNMWDAETKFVLGYVDLSGKKQGESTDFPISLIKRSADEGFVLAQYIIGNCYDEGYGVSRDSDKAIYWWRKAAIQELDEAKEKVKLSDPIAFAEMECECKEAEEIRKLKAAVSEWECEQQSKSLKETGLSENCGGEPGTGENQCNSCDSKAEPVDKKSDKIWQNPWFYSIISGVILMFIIGFIGAVIGAVIVFFVVKKNVGDSNSSGSKAMGQWGETDYQSRKSKTVAIILSIFLGWAGIDRFYLGDIAFGILKLLTFGLFGFMWIHDIYQIFIDKLVPSEIQAEIEESQPECKQCGRKYDLSNKWAFPPFCSMNCQTNYKMENARWQ